MTLNYNVTGAKRKELVNLIANFTGYDAIIRVRPVSPTRWTTSP